MENHYILSKVPKHTEIYVFGSILRSSNPNDLDIIIVYDPFVYPLYTIYDSSNSLIVSLHERFNVKVHAVYLSYGETKECTFIKDVGAITLIQFLNEYSS